jgi:hypothetical protein
MATPGAFTFSRAVREWCFVQLPLMHLDDFRKAARQRDLDVFGLMDPKPFETLDRDDILPPVAYALHGFFHLGYDQTQLLQQGDLLIT